MRIILTAATGLPGKYIWKELEQDYEIIPFSLKQEDKTVQCDLGNEEDVSDALEKYRPDLILHTEEINDIDYCERKPEVAHKINTIMTRNLLWYATRVNSAFLYLSTNYVFEGSKASPYVEEDSTKPLNIYGISKLGGEKYVSYLNTRYFILRTGLVYGSAGANFVQSILEKLRSNNKVEVPLDEATSFISGADLAQALKVFLKKVLKENSAYGIYHLANSGVLTKYQLALEIAKYLGFDSNLIQGFKSGGSFSKTSYPLYSGLSSQKFQDLTGFELRDWKTALEEFLSNYEVKR